MSTDKEWDVPKPRDGEVLPSSKTAGAVARLESDLQKERDERKEERFYWIAGLVMVGNVPIFAGMPSAWLCLPIFLLEVVILIGLADKLGVDRVSVLLEKLYARYLNEKPPE